MTTQTDLFRSPNREKLAAKVKVMTADLERIRMIPVRDFTATHGWSDRTCRAIVNESGGAIVATEEGYVLNGNATDAEFREANGRIYSQGKELLRRALKERSYRHRSIGGGNSNG